MSGEISSKLREMLINAFNKKETGIKSDVLNILFNEEREKISRRSAYNYDYSSISFPSLSDINKKYLEKHIFKYEIGNKLRKVVKSASDFGISAILHRVFNDHIYQQNVEFLDRPKIYFGVLHEAFLTKDRIDYENIDKGGEEGLRLYLNTNGNYQLDNIKIYKTKEGGFTTEIMSLNKGDGTTNKLTYEYANGINPLNILENNESAKADYAYAVELIKKSVKFNAIIETEWEYTKIQLLNNLVYNPEKTGPEVQDDIENGAKRVHEIADPDGKLQTALTYLSSGGITVDIAKAIKDNYKDDVRELTFMFEKLSGGNNKHTTEFLGSNLDAFRYIFAKKDFFQIFLQKFFYNIIQMSSMFPNTTESLDDEMLKVNFSLSRPIEMLLSMNEDTTKAQSSNTTTKPKTEPEPESKDKEK